MRKSRRAMTAALIGSVALASLAGCENLPGSPGAQGAVIGGASGAAAGAIIAEENRLLGALIGGAVGAGGGYLIGANWDKITGNEKDEAVAANQKAQENPATAADVANSSTADLNRDGFVTLDEVVAMKNAGLTDDQMVQRLRAADQIYELTPEQEQYLLDHGVTRNVVTQMRSINQDKRQQLLERSEAIGKPV